MNIEETIKIMLKGAAEHTSIEEIREKLKRVDQENRPLRIKLGLDPSAPDIHLGHAEEIFKTAFQKQQAPDNTPQILFDTTTNNIEQELVNAIMSSGKYASKAEIRRLIAQGAVKINGNKFMQSQPIECLKDKDIVQIGKGTFFEIKVK